jgi:hypothetical protein
MHRFEKQQYGVQKIQRKMSSLFRANAKLHFRQADKQ